MWKTRYNLRQLRACDRKVDAEKVEKRISFHSFMATDYGDNASKYNFHSNNVSVYKQIKYIHSNLHTCTLTIFDYF